MDSGVSDNSATPSDAAEPTCGHECSEESGCITEELNCTHTHDDLCGYIAAVEGHDCHYECVECAEKSETLTTEVCTCEAAEGEAHAEDCALYEAPADPICTCETKCAEDAINPDCPVCAAEGADLTACTGEEPAPVCDCGTDDESIHATTCAVYVAPENPVCYCAEKCTETNIWCDVCGIDYTACGGTDTAVPYADCTCTSKCAEDSPNSECAVCSADGADLTACIGGSVAKVGDTYYTDFTTAVANWTDNTTLTLLADVTDLAEQIELSGNGLVLDLNGKKLEATVDKVIKITAGEMTIRDSAGTGSFTTTQYRVLLLSGGNVNFESGILESVTISKGTFNMTGGTIQAEVFNGIYVSDDEGTANISGGEIRVTDNNRAAIYNGFGTLNVSGNVVITSTYGYAIQNSSASVLTTISGDVALNGSDGEFYLAKAIVLNTQPTGDTTWRVNINTGSNSGIENGVFANPGEGVTLDPAKFTSLIDGYGVKLNNKNDLVLCNHSAATVAVSNGNGTHNTTCDCNETTFESNIACSGGVATTTHLAVCAYCGGNYGELDANVN